MIIPQYVFNRDRHQKQLSIMTICKNKVFFKSWKRLSFLSNYEGIKHIKDYWNKRNHICFEFVLQEQKISVLNIFTSTASSSLTNPWADNNKHKQYPSMLYNNPYCFTKSKSISLILLHLWLKLNILLSPPRTPPLFIVKVIAQIVMDKAVNRKNMGIPLLQKDVGILLTKPKPLFLDFYQI